MNCAACKKDVHPVKELDFQRGFLNKCPTCHGGLPDDEAVQPAPKQATKKPATVAHLPKPTSGEQDTLTMVRARHAFVCEQVESLRQFEAEAAMLQRMIEAAEPMARVIPISK